MSHSAHGGLVRPPLPCASRRRSSSVMWPVSTSRFSLLKLPVPPHIPPVRGVGKMACAGALAGVRSASEPRVHPDRASFVLRDGIEDQVGDLGDDGVAEASDAVCPIGNPISHSENSGFSEPWIGRPSASCTAFGSWSRCGLPPLESFRKVLSQPFGCFQSRAAGVGHVRPGRFASRIASSITATCVVSFHCPRGCNRAASFSAASCDTPSLAFARGVAHNVPGAGGVGNDPDPVSLVRRTNGGRGDTMPFRIVPERHEVAEDNVQSLSAKARGVFDDDPRRRDFPDDAGVVFPESTSFSMNALAARIRDGDVLTRETPHQYID